MARRLYLCWIYLLLFICMGNAHAEQPKLVSSGTVVGPGVVAPDQWGLAQTSVVNPTMSDQTLLTTVTFTKDARMGNVQFAREFWIPAGGRRDIYIPFKSPDYPSNTKSIEAQVQLLDTRGSSDVMLSRDVALYRAVTSPQINAKMFSLKSAAGYDLTGSLREQLGVSHTYMNLKPHGLPRDANLLSNMSVMLLGHSDPQLDPMQIQALRQWILAGGQMIVVLPDTGMELTRSIIGDHLPMMLIDQSLQTQATIQGNNVLSDGGLNSRVSNKDQRPRGWELDDLRQNRVDVNGGGTRLRNPDNQTSTIISNTVTLSEQWATVDVSARFRMDRSSSPSDTVSRAIFLDQMKQPVGNPIDFADNLGSNWRENKKTLSIPNSATHLKIELGLDNAKGTLWVSDCKVIPTAMRFEEPVSFWRVLGPDMQTDDDLMINGWPMMLRGKMGRGQVTVLTLGTEYWSAASKAGSRVIDQAFRTNSRFNKSDTLIDNDILAKAGTQQIGYEVLSRTPVMICLLTMLGLMLVSGIVFWKKGNPEMLAPVSVVLAIVIAGVIWFMGITHHRQTPLTVASVQLAQIDPVGNYAITNAVVSTYSPSRLSSPLEANDGGVIWPDLSGSTGKVLRMRWTDNNTWKWDNLELPEATLRSHSIARVVPLDKPVKATASFTKDGMICTISSGPYAGVDHPIIASLNNHAVGKLTGHDNFTITPDPTIGLDQFVTATTMTAQDIQRQDIYRHLIYPNSDALNVVAYPSEPSAMWWARAMDIGFTQAANDARQKQQALICVPLSYERPAPGTTFVIPSPILQTDIFRSSKNDHGMSTVINPMTGRWTSTISSETKFKLAFKVPKELLPLKVQSGTLDIDFKTQGRDFIVTDNRRQEIARRSNLANRIQIPVKGEFLTINRQGQIVLEFEVTTHTDPLSSHMWDASGGIRLQITAVTQ